MTPVKILKLIILCVSIGLLLWFIWWVYYLPKPTPGHSCKNTGWQWDDSCLYFQELFPDPTLASPSEIQPYLIGFEYVPGAGNPLNLPMWYRFRYVNVKTGGYSAFSKWTASPVLCGSCCLPCPGGVGVCAIKQGGSSCLYNQPTIGVSYSDSQYNPYIPQQDGSYIYMNVHRYVGKTFTDTTPPSDNVQDEIVGYMISGKTYEGTPYYGVIDVLFNPCESTTDCPTPSWCSSGGSDCSLNSCSSFS